MSVHVEGMAHLVRALDTVAPNQAINVLRGTLTRQAKLLRDDVRKRAPVSTGRLRRAIKHRRMRGTRTIAEAAVYVAKGKSRGDMGGAWYWHFVEFGTHKKPARPYVTPAYEAARRPFRASFQKDFFKRFERLMKRNANKPGGAK